MSTKISPKLRDALVHQVKVEVESAYTYLGMATYFHAKELLGFAHWMRLQTQEELKHALKVFDHLVNRGAAFSLPAIDAPPTEYRSPKEVFEKTLAHEESVTRSITELMRLAKAENDYLAEVVLQWFVTEQLEEETEAQAILSKLNYIGDSGEGLIILDQKLSERLLAESESD